MRRIFRGLLCALVLLCLAGPVRAFELETPFFQGKRVMVLVPHQDDEINLAGGIMEQYARAGSEVYLVYATNGDYNALAEERSREALAVAESLGIEKVIYLGYGDQWQPQDEQKHLYFAADGGAVWTSHYGAAATYGTSVIEPWRQSAYTRDNFLRDLTELILELRPDVIYCNDYDAHHDHMALDLFFEEVMGNILTARTDYRPAVYKGLCYGTAWYAEPDFVGAENLRASQHPQWEHWDRLGIGYDWARRVRLPLSEGNLSRLLSKNQVYRSLALFCSQYGHRFAESVLNGDKVFFERRTDSLLYRARFLADGEETTVFNDFKLKDSREFSSLINSGVRFARVIEVELESPVVMDAVWLYDAPGLEDNILAGFLEFPDGTRVDFGALDPGGDATAVKFRSRAVESFRVHVTAFEGDAPGLTEIEGYWRAKPGKLQMVMAVDENGDFAYDYRMPEGGTMAFSLYSYPGEISWEDVEVSISGGAEAAREEGLLHITCLPGRRASVTITAPGGVQTTFTVTNPHRAVRKIADLWQKLDRDTAIAIDELLCARENGK